MAYNMAINNLKRYIRSNRNMNVFDAAFVLAVAFCKDTNEVVADLIAE